MRIAIVGALLVIAGCGGGAGGIPPGGIYSCRAGFPGIDGGAGTLVLCLEASGGTAQDLAKNRQQCAAQGNAFVSEPCPRAGALGGCRERAAGANIVLTTWYYADGTGTADDIRMLCEGLASVAPTGLIIDFVPP